MAQNILLIQDDPSDANAVREALINSSDGPFKVVWVRRCSEGLERLTREGALGTDSITAVLVDPHPAGQPRNRDLRSALSRGAQDSDPGPERFAR